MTTELISVDARRLDATLVPGSLFSLSRGAGERERERERDRDAG